MFLGSFLILYINVNVLESENLQKIEIGHSTVPAMSKEHTIYVYIYSVLF